MRDAGGWNSSFCLIGGDKIRAILNHVDPVHAYKLYSNASRLGFAPALFNWQGRFPDGDTLSLVRQAIKVLLSHTTHERSVENGIYTAACTGESEEVQILWR